MAGYAYWLVAWIADAMREASPYTRALWRGVCKKSEARKLNM